MKSVWVPLDWIISNSAFLPSPNAFPEPHTVVGINCRCLEPGCLVKLPAVPLCVWFSETDITCLDFSFLICKMGKTVCLVHGIVVRIKSAWVIMVYLFLSTRLSAPEGKLFFWIFMSFIYFIFQLHWVFVATHGLSLLAVSGGCSVLRSLEGFSLQWLLLLWHANSRARASVVAAQWL